MGFDLRYGMPLPAPADRYMPKKHGPLLSRLVTEAWTARDEALKNQSELLAVAETLAAWLERENPPEDMEVLRRYGKTETVEDIYARVWDEKTSRWEHSVSIDLPRKVEVAGNGNYVYIGGEHKDEAPNSTEPYFFAVVEARRAYKAEYRTSTEWPGVVRKETGAFPLWREIEARLPVLGAWMAKVRASVDAPLAAVAD